MKNSAHILGLDLGTNSVGWALLNANQFRIAGNGSRIIPMTGDVMTDFAKGKLQSAASQRTAFRNVRKNIERVKQRQISCNIQNDKKLRVNANMYSI